MIRLHLSNHLLDYLDDFCSRQAPTCALGACVNEKDCQSSRLSMTLIADRDVDPEFGRFRRSIRDVRCHQCTMILILQTIQRNVPANRQEAWMNEPLIDLGGRTPRQCLDTNDFDSLINALWLLDQSELTDG
jgi:hypothetical protein